MKMGTWATRTYIVAITVGMELDPASYMICLVVPKILTVFRQFVVSKPYAELVTDPMRTHKCGAGYGV